MKFGICCGLDKLPILKQEGFDYIELNFSNIASLSNEEFEEVLQKVEFWGIPAEAFNVFFRPDIRLYGDVDWDFLANYCETGFSRAQRLGGAVAVLGSGGARKIPDGLDLESATKQFVDVINVVGDAALRHGMQVAIEPLNTGETNFINTVEEGLNIMRAANHKAVHCLADFFHVSLSQESLTAIETAGADLIHVHLAAPITRFFPTLENEAICRQWKEALNKCGYDARISLEGKARPDLETAIQATKPILDLFR